MTWDILILTIPTRQDYLTRLLKQLEPQALHSPGVQVVVGRSGERFQRGKRRAQMIRDSKADYVSFVDDDDLVSEDYVSTIHPLLNGVDYVGFQVQLYWGGPEQNIKGGPPTEHSLKYPHWYSNNDGHFRDISHLNPIRRELAAQALQAYEGMDSGEDVAWADAMRTLGIVKTEHYIPKVMYHYYCRPGHAD